MVRNLKVLEYEPKIRFGGACGGLERIIQQKTRFLKTGSRQGYMRLYAVLGEKSAYMRFILLTFFIFFQILTRIRLGICAVFKT